MSQVYSNVIQFYIYIYRIIYILFFRFFSIIGYYKTLNISPCAICCLSILFLFFIIKKYLFIWLCWVLVVASGICIFVEACGTFLVVACWI